MKKLLEATAYKMSFLPEAYGFFHLAFFVGSLVFGFLLAFLLRRISDCRKDRLLLTLGLLLAVSEVYKQLFLYFVENKGSYDWWYFPFQLCSLPMYLCLFVPFLKNGRLKTGFYTFLCTFNLLGGIMAFVEPSGLIHPYWTWTMHSFLWHSVIIFIGFFVWLSGRADLSLRGYADAAGIFFVTAGIATGLNVALNQVSEGNIDMFYINPFYPSEQIVFHEISLSIGIVPGIVVYLSAVCLGAFMVWMGQRFCCRSWNFLMK